MEQETKIGFIPTCLSASPEGALLFALSEKGLIQCLDIALNPIQLSSPGEEDQSGTLLDIGQFFKSPIIVKDGSWSPTKPGIHAPALAMDFTFFLVRIQGGPLLTFRISSGVLADGRLGPLQVMFVNTVSCNLGRRLVRN